MNKLSHLRCFGYGITDFGLNLFYTYLNFFLLLYYTDVLLIPPAVAGLIFAVGVVWDGLTDPPMGIIASRTRTRFGSYRPYLLFGAPLLAGSFILMFAAPLLFPGALVASCLIAHLLFRACYTLVAIPHAALSANMTRDSGERSVLAGYRMVLAPLGGLVTAIATWDLAHYLGQSDLKIGFFWVSVIYSVAGTMLFWLTFLSTKERRHETQKIPVGIGQIWRFVTSNEALLILLAAIVLNSIGQAIFSAALAHYIVYVSSAPIEVPIALVTILASVTLGVPVWTYVARYISKRLCWVLGAMLAIIAQIMVYTLNVESAGVLVALLVTIGFGTSSYIVMMWAMLPDTIEFGEWKSGLRDEGVVFGVNQFSIKSANGIGIALLGFVLGIGGFVAGTEQSSNTQFVLNTTALLVPAICSAGAVLIIWFYPIDRKTHQKLVEELGATSETAH